MHYYSFNIGDYVSSTQHLEPMEDLAYRRMLDLYYSKESPLPDDVDEIARLIRMRTHTECIALVLQDFFTLDNGFWHCDRADSEIDKYQGKSLKAKKSAEARWKNKQKQSERNANALQAQTKGNANHKPITNNHKTINKLDWSATQMSESEIAEIKRIRKLAKADVSQRVINQLAKQFQLSRNRGFSNDDILNEWSIKGWRSYKDEWMKGTPRKDKSTSSAFQPDFEAEMAAIREGFSND